MKVLIISNLYAPYARGGAERVAQLQAEGLRAVGHDVVVLSSGPRIRLGEGSVSGIRVLQYFPINIFWYKNISQHVFLARLIWHFFDAINLQGARVLDRVLENEKPDLIITHNIKGLGMLMAYRLSDFREKWIHVIHDVQLAVPSGLMRFGKEKQAQNGIIARFWQSYCRMIFNSPRIVISPSRWLLDFYKEKNYFKNSKKEVLPNPVVLEKEVEHQPGEKLHLLYIGQIEEHKGIVWLLNNLKGIEGDFEMKVVGDGSAMEKIKKIAQDDKRIKILGKKNRDEINNILQQTDVTVVPSLVYENSPAVIYESLAAGVSVLAARIGGVAELIEEDKNGWTFEAGSTDKFNDRLRNLLTSPHLIAGMNADCRTTVSQYEVSRYIEDFLKIVE